MERQFDGQLHSAVIDVWRVDDFDAFEQIEIVDVGGGGIGNAARKRKNKSSASSKLASSAASGKNHLTAMLESIT